MLTFPLSDVNDGNVVLVVVIQVLACHTPDEGIIIGAGSSVHTPLRRHDGLLVVEPNVTALLRLAHHVRNGLSVRQIEVIVSLDTTTVGVRRHRVPNSTGVELGQAKLQLAGTFLKNIIHDELINGAVVGFLNSAYRAPDSCLQRTFTSVEGNPLSFVMLVSGSTVQIELCRLGGILRAEFDRFVDVLVLANMAATDVESLFG